MKSHSDEGWLFFLNYLRQDKPCITLMDLRHRFRNKKHQPLSAGKLIALKHIKAEKLYIFIK